MGAEIIQLFPPLIFPPTMLAGRGRKMRGNVANIFPGKLIFREKNIPQLSTVYSIAEGEQALHLIQ